MDGLTLNRFEVNPACGCPWCRAYPADPPATKHFRAAGREPFDNFGRPHIPRSRAPWARIEAGL